MLISVTCARRTLSLSSRFASCRLLHKAIPPKPLDADVDLSKVPPKTTEIDHQTILQLERVALVDFANEEGLRRLKAAVQLADTISVVDTKNVSPLYSVLEDRALYLQSDEITDGNIKKEVLKNATLTEEDYFVAPSGNIPLDQQSK